MAIESRPICDCGELMQRNRTNLIHNWWCPDCGKQISEHAAEYRPWVDVETYFGKLLTKKEER